MSYDNEQVEIEGKAHGDVLQINAPDTSAAPTRFEEFNALLRWLRVAYFERFDYVLCTEDDSFVSLFNLLPYLESHSSTKFFYGGFVNSFTEAPLSYQHKYFAPFAEQGTIVLSSQVVELLAQELGEAKPLSRFDATISHFLAPFTFGKPVHDQHFIGNIKNVYSAVQDPIVINHVDPEILRVLSTPTIGSDGKVTSPALPAQVEEMQSRSIFIDPHPKDQQPECDAMGGGCNSPSAKMMNAEPARF
jgi:hypothetical protein